MKLFRILFFTLTLVLVGIGSIGCQTNSFEEAGETIDEAAGEVNEKVEEVNENVWQAVDEMD